MAISYSSWAGNSGHSYRLKLQVSLNTQNEAANKSSVRIRAWLESRNSSYFSTGSSREMRFSGTELMSSSSSFSITPNGTKLIGDYDRTVEHNSHGERQVQASVSFSNGFTGSQSTYLAVDLPRIDQYPSAPSAAPTITRSGSSVTIVSANASGNGGSITGWQIQHRTNHTGSYGSWITSSSKSTTVEVPRPPLDYQLQAWSRAQTSRGWGPWSSIRTITIPASVVPGEIDGVELSVEPGKVIANWEAPFGDVLSYEAALYDGTSWGAETNVGLNLSHEFTGLSAGDYTVRVRSVLADGPTAWSTSDPIYLGELPGPVPSVTFTIEGEAIWEPPTDTGGLDLEGYDVAWHDGIEWLSSELVIDLTSSYSDKLPGIGYRCRVAAINSLGVGTPVTSEYFVSTICPCAA